MTKEALVPHVLLPPAVRDLVLSVVLKYEIQFSELMSGTHERRVVAARREACAILHSRGFSLQTVGRFLRIHHTSVAYHIQKYKRGLAQEHESPVPVPDESGVWAI